MSKFSEKIDSLIDESGENVQSLAKNGNFNRTTLQRVKTGERLPTRTFFRQLCETLRLSPAEEAELHELYEIQKLGAQHYENRQKIVELIETITELTEQEIQFSKEMSKTETRPLSVDRPLTQNIVTDQTAVLESIRNAIDRELFNTDTPQIRMFIPGEKEPIYDHIFQQLMGNKKHLVLEDVIHLPRVSDGSATAKYLTTLKYLISISVLKNVSYQSNYAYFEAGDIEYSALFPYYLLTSDRTLTISADFKRLVIHEEASIHQLYQDDFANLQEKTDAFIIESRDLYEIFGMDQFRVTHQFMNALPAIGLYFTREMIASKVNQAMPYYELFQEAVVATYEQFQKGKSTMTTYFSLDYLRGFVLGQCIFFPPDVCHPFTRAEGMEFLKKTRDDLETGAIKACAMSDKLYANYGFFEILQTDEAIRLVLHYADAEEMIYKAIELKEKRIIDLFADFFMDLPDSDYVLTRDETITQLDEMIAAFDQVGGA
jgi:transcriptional regulator with XRE-family HTH domain